MLLEVKRRKVKRISQNRMKRNVILAIGLVLERESEEMADFQTSLEEEEGTDNQT